MKKKAAVAMSGGVDSSAVAAHLLELGWEVIGLTMHLWSGDPHATATGRTCCATEDLHDARRVAAHLGIPFYVINLEEVFREAVVAPFIRAYAAGLTPNPCILCNQVLKFDHLLARAKALDAEFLATGHYALREEDPDGFPRLGVGRDPAKDQSYFLFSVPIETLRYLRFPLGDLCKEQTRELANRLGLHVASKRESQDLCFVPNGNLADFFSRQAPQVMTPGEIRDGSGRVLGHHQGLGGYTVGQRRGLGLTSPLPLYVIAIDPLANQLIVGPETELWRDSLVVQAVNWLDRAPPTASMSVEAKIRYAAPPVPAVLEPLPDRSIRVRFATPQRAITPGQAVVFYRGRHVLGGGWIQPE